MASVVNVDTDQQMRSSKSDGEPFAVCMSCRSEFPIEIGICPTCNVSVSLVRNCPACGQVLSAKHAKCLYCGYVIVQPLASAGAPDAVVARERPVARRRQIAAVAVSLVVFLAVFTGASLFTRYQENKIFLPAKIASTYALRDAAIYRDPLRSSAELGHLKPTGMVDVIGYRLAGADLQWYQVAWKGRPGYTPAKDFAPPKIERADGSKLLELAILQLHSPELIQLGREAVEYYRQRFPQSHDGDYLLWLLAERTREVSRAKHDQALSRQARAHYEQLASRGGELGENARKRLQELQASSLAVTSSKGQESLAPEIQIVDGSTFSGSPQHKGAHQITVVDQTELSIRLPMLADLVEGTVLQGQVVKAVRAGDEVTIHAGSACSLRVVQRMQDRNSALVQLISLQVGNRRLAVSPPPVAVPISAAPSKPVTFRVPTPLLIPD